MAYEIEIADLERVRTPQDHKVMAADGDVENGGTK